MCGGYWINVDICGEGAFIFIKNASLINCDFDFFSFHSSVFFGYYFRQTVKCKINKNSAKKVQSATNR